MTDSAPSPAPDAADRPEGFRRVTGLLAELGHPHAPLWLTVSARTCAEAADALQVQVGQIAKSVIFRRKADEVAVLVVASGYRHVDEKKMAAQVGHATPPVVLIDRDLFRFDEVWAAAGHPNGVFRLAPQALVVLTGAPVADVVVA